MDSKSDDCVVSLNSIGMDDVARVGGKNASLGEMIQHLAASGVNVPGGFATTACAFRRFLSEAGLTKRISAELEDLDAEDVKALARTGRSIRKMIIDTPIEGELRDAIAPLSNNWRAKPAARWRSPCDPRRRPKIYPMRRSPASRKHFSTCAASITYCWR